MNITEDKLKQIQEGFKRAEDQGKEGNVGTKASKKRKRVETEADYRVAMEFGAEKLMIQHVRD